MPKMPPIAKRKKAQKAHDHHATYSWRKTSKRYRLDQPICERCIYLDQLAQRSCEGLSVHHIVSIENGGNDEDENLLTLCYACHGRWSAMERDGKSGQAEEEGREVKGYD
jgi:5-methylcytosine-specific restriction protein A